MMRSLYSAVSGLKTHQTKMDVIGNNISNVNTVAFKSSSVTFSSIMYQTLSGASGANAEAGTGGINAKQIGLGVTTGSTAMTITSAGASETTGLPFDLRITDKSTSSFFIVNNGSENVFTKAGSFYVDGAGNLCMKSTGYTVMGWGVDAETQTIRKDTVSALKVMAPENMTSEPEATTKARCTGVVDGKNAQVTSSTGSVMNLLVYDNLGYPYTARFAIQAQDTQGGKYAVNLTDIIDAQGNSILTSNVSLGELFGPGSGGSAQGSNTDITDNYEFSTGKSKNDINRAIQTNATSKAAAAGTTTKPTYTYYWDAADVNAQLGLTGKQALPDGYRVRFTSESVTLKEALADLKKSPKTEFNDYVYVEDASGNVVARGEASVRDEQEKVSINGVDCNVSGVQWVFTDGKIGANGEFQPETETGGGNKLSNFTLTQEQTLENYTSLGTIVTSNEGITGYRFNVEDIRDALNLQKGEAPDAYPENAVIYYWPTFSAGGSISLTGATGEITTFSSMVALENGTTALNMPVKYAGVEELLKDYSYTSITGSDLANATSATGSIFTEELPSDAEIRYNMFGGNYHIVTPSKDGFTLQFNTVDGTLTSVGGGSNLSQTLNLSKLSAAGYDGFKDVTIDFSALLNYNKSGSTTAAMSGGDADTVGKGKKLGAMTGMSVDQSGKIYASYDNGNTVLLGQISVAQFANASGLEATGDNCYRATLNSGEFDGIGVEIDADGSSISAGELEMSNVDLAGEFTSMITTQRGFQANSRVITTSDTLLEELINLKR
ncbi:MAG: flagellar hook-basal body complex protein [Lachnospiraceae bacterium]|nr:flagellar hook-basal body complex protein [Lachnospiraceae bacterium]